MSFASIEFAVFSSIFFGIYILVSLKQRIKILAISSLCFYAYWDYRFLPLLLISASIDYFCALKIHHFRHSPFKKYILWFSVAANASILIFFKYLSPLKEREGNLFIPNTAIDDIIIPLGISFYTFQTLSYTIDVYRQKFAPERDFIVYVGYVSFFPQLVAGPIERGKSLLPQLKNLNNIKINDFITGICLIIWGLYAKLCIADNLRSYVLNAFSSEASGYLYWLVGGLSVIMIYADFFAYSQIAIGLAKIIGVNLTQNFQRPLLAVNMTAFWQRWHITLTRWIADYIHIPLALKYQNKFWRSSVAIFALILVAIWHAATLNFLIYGIFHGVVLQLWSPVSQRLRIFAKSYKVRTLFSHLTVIVILSLSGPLFLITNFSQLQIIIAGMFSNNSAFETLTQVGGKLGLVTGVIACIPFFLIELVLERKRLKSLEEMFRKKTNLIGFTIALAFLVLAFGEFDAQPFVYFEF